MEKGTKFKHWIVCALHSDMKGFELEKLSRPAKVGKVATPADLNDMTLGQMVEMSMCKNGVQMFYKVCNVMLGLEPKQVDNCKAVEVVRFTGWMIGQIETINKLFDKAKSKPTDEEVKAGISRLKFGIFGVIDWYACRMGITDHEEVTKVPWLRVYKCMDMDNQVKEFNKRLSKVYADEYRK